MPSSTSSSEREIPAGPWTATWLVAAAVAIAAIAGLEWMSRARGHRPSITDDPVWWSVARRRVGDEPRDVVFLGASRMALGYSPQAFAEAAPELRGYQLSISDYLPLAVLADLADDDSFRGIAVLDLIESEIADPLLSTDAHAYVARSHALWRAPGALANRYLATLAQSELAILGIGGRRIVTSVFTGKWPPPAWVAIDRERVSHADYALAPPAALRQKAERRVANLAPAPPPERWLAAMQRDFEPLVRKIRARGGDVIVVHTPISGELARKLDEMYPRAAYWDVFAAHTAAHVIHYRDVPALRDFTCPDEMHLDERDQDRFTRALVDTLRARGLLDRRAGAQRM